VAGFLNDMNEPAMHDRPLAEPGSENLEPPGDLPHGPHDEPAEHAEVRNLYALLENEGTYRALRRMRPDERPFLLTRSGFAGVQRFAGVWTGDSSSVWEHLESALPQLLNLGLSGVPFAGGDIGGFFESCGPELLVRWSQLGALSPLARNHSARDTAPQEPWAWGEEVERACRRALELRYRLLPYLYTAFEEAGRTGAPVLRPLVFHYPEDEAVRDLSDQALVGRDLLFAAVVRPGVRARAVYLPDGIWFDLRTGEQHEGSRWILAEARLDQDAPLFARGGAIVPLGPAAEHSGRPLDPLTLAVFPDRSGAAEGRLYEDDGRSFAYELGEACTTVFSWADADGTLRARRGGRFEPPPRGVRTALRWRDGAAEHDLGPDTGTWERATP
jgi:alpha-glucosidase